MAEPTRFYDEEPEGVDSAPAPTTCGPRIGLKGILGAGVKGMLAGAVLTSAVVAVPRIFPRRAPARELQEPVAASLSSWDAPPLRAGSPPSAAPRAAISTASAERRVRSLPTHTKHGGHD